MLSTTQIDFIETSIANNKDLTIEDKFYCGSTKEDICYYIRNKHGKCFILKVLKRTWGDFVIDRRYCDGFHFSRELYCESDVTNKTISNCLNVMADDNYYNRGED